MLPVIRYQTAFNAMVFNFRRGMGHWDEYGYIMPFVWDMGACGAAVPGKAFNHWKHPVLVPMPQTRDDREGCWSGCVDLLCTPNTAVYSIMDGVIRNSYSRNFGDWSVVIVEHESALGKFWLIYKGLDTQGFKREGTVERNEPIAKLGRKAILRIELLSHENLLKGEGESFKDHFSYSYKDQQNQSKWSFRELKEGYVLSSLTPAKFLMDAGIEYPVKCFNPLYVFNLLDKL
jgi:hypothetical protein